MKRRQTATNYRLLRLGSFLGGSDCMNSVTRDYPCHVIAELLFQSSSVMRLSCDCSTSAVFVHYQCSTRAARVPATMVPLQYHRSTSSMPGFIHTSARRSGQRTAKIMRKTGSTPISGAQIGPTQPDSGRFRPKLGRIQPECVELGPRSVFGARIGRSWSDEAWFRHLPSGKGREVGRGAVSNGAYS